MGGKKTDDLIEQALSNLGGDTGEQESPSDEIVEVDEESSSKETVAQIDLQQYVSKEAYMRLAADFDNFRRRALKERKEWERQGKDQVLTDMLDVLDNFSRGLDQAKEEKSALATGMRMVYSQIQNLMQQHGLSRIITEGQKFDPSLHDAIAKVEKPGEEDGKILEEVKCGWKYPERLLRPASVIVVKNKTSGDSSEGENV